MPPKYVQPWAEELSPEDRVWFETYMPEILAAQEEDAKDAISRMDLEKLKSITDESTGLDNPPTSDEIDKAFGITEEVNIENDVIKESIVDTQTQYCMEDGMEISKTFTDDGLDFQQYQNEEFIQEPDDEFTSEQELNQENLDFEDESWFEDYLDHIPSKPEPSIDTDLSGFDTFDSPYDTPVQNAQGEQLTAIMAPIRETVSYQEEETSQNEEPIKKSKEPNKYRKRAHIALVALITLLLCAVAIIAWLASLYSSDAHLDPNPRSLSTPAIEVPSNDDTIDWPVIDWEYWQSRNKDIIGWVSVPGTSINHAIVQEKDSNKGFYLQHDIEGNWSYLGVPYLDADCTEQGLDSRVCPIAGHHMSGTDSVFAEFSNFNDLNFANEHQVILLQTPNWNKKLLVQAATIVPGWQSSLVTNFETDDSWRSWWNQQYANARTKVAQGAQSYGNLYLFYTCSYFENPANERTLVFAMEPARATGNHAEKSATQEREEFLARAAEQKKERDAERKARLEEAEKIIEADRIKKEQEKEAKETSSSSSADTTSSSSASSSASSATSSSTTQPQTPTQPSSPATPVSFASKHLTGDASAHTDGSINMWQEGFYMVGSLEAADVITAKKAGDSISLDGKNLLIEQIIDEMSGDYVAQRQTLGWDKTIVSVNGKYYICNDGSSKQFTTVVIDGQSYTFDANTGRVAVEEEED